MNPNRRVESAEDAIVREYRKLARRYDERWAFYVEATVRETIPRMDLQPSSRVLDVACGTGVLLDLISAMFVEAKLSGTDLSPEMLQVARSRLGLTVDLREGRVDALPYEDGSFDIVVSTNAFHFFARPDEALREMSRVLRPGGRLIVTDWCDDYLACRICDRLLRVFSPAHRRIYGADECAGLMRDAEFEHVTVDRYKIDWLWGMMTASGGKSRGA